MTDEKTAKPKPTRAPRTSAPDKVDASKRATTGVWIIHREGVATSVHADELEARRIAMDEETGARVAFIPWGGSIIQPVEVTHANR